MSNLGNDDLLGFETDMVLFKERPDQYCEDGGLTFDVGLDVLVNPPSDLDFGDYPSFLLPSDSLDLTQSFELPHPGNRQATSNHKGVHQRKVNGKWAARLCVDSRKVDLGEYTTEDAASRAYQVGAFYYNKPLENTSQSLVDSLPCVPDNLSDGEKRCWVRERARHYALTVDGKSTSKSTVLAGSSSLPSTSDSYGSKSVLAGSSSLESRPSTPNSYGAHASCGNYNSPTTSGSVSELLRIGIAAEEGTRFKRQKCVQTTLPDEERNQALPHITNSTDSILFALCELRKQGWNYRLESRSPGSVEAGVLFSLPQGQHTGPPLLMTDIIISSFYELREQGWEVHLEPSKRDESCSSSVEREGRQVADRASLHPPIAMVHPTFHEVRRGGCGHQEFPTPLFLY